MSKENSKIVVINFILLVVMLIGGMLLKSDPMLIISILGILVTGCTVIIVEELKADGKGE